MKKTQITLTGKQYIFLFHKLRRAKKEAEKIAKGETLGGQSDPDIINRSFYKRTVEAIPYVSELEVDKDGEVEFEVPVKIIKHFKQVASQTLEIIGRNIMPELDRRLEKFRNNKVKVKIYKAQKEQTDELVGTLKDMVKRLDT